MSASAARPVRTARYKCAPPGTSAHRHPGLLTIQDVVVILAGVIVSHQPRERLPHKVKHAFDVPEHQHKHQSQHHPASRPQGASEVAEGMR
eukprot:364183-Chlamydomonas_euryale.AAC.24